MLIDENNSHEYFGHKYNVSNNIKNSLNLFAKNLKLLRANKEFLTKNLEKNIYLYGKNHIIYLNILNFVVNTKYKLENFSKNFKKYSDQKNINSKLMENI